MDHKMITHITAYKGTPCFVLGDPNASFSPTICLMKSCQHVCAYNHAALTESKCCLCARQDLTREMRCSICAYPERAKGPTFSA